MTSISLFLNKFRKEEVIQLEKNNTLEHLERIIDLHSGKKNNPIDFYAKIRNGKLTFKHKNKNIIDTIPLKSLKFIKKTISSYYVWEVDYKEYKQIYHKLNIKALFASFYDESKGSFKNYINEDLKSTFDFLTLHKNDHHCNYVMKKYEITIFTVLDTILEAIRINDCVTEEIKCKSKKLLDEFISDVNQIKNEKEQLQILEKTSMNQNLESRLDIE